MAVVIKFLFVWLNSARIMTVWAYSYHKENMRNSIISLSVVYEQNRVLYLTTTFNEEIAYAIIMMR